MNTKILSSFLLMVLFSLGCQKDKTGINVDVRTVNVEYFAADSVVCTGEVINMDGVKILAMGFCWSTSPGPTLTSSVKNAEVGIGQFKCTIKNLDFGVKYYFKAYVKTETGTLFGEEKSITTNLTPPIVSTIIVKNINEINVVCEALVVSNGGLPVEEKGFCWNTTGDPTVSDSKIVSDQTQNSYSNIIQGLSPGTKYYLKSFAKNSMGVSYSKELSFTTLKISYNNSIQYGTLTDIEGNVYKTVQIGHQTWMADNLKTTRLNDGTQIPEVKNHSVWRTLKSPAFCWYNNDTTSKFAYGALYNWYAVETEKLCPDGWHVPTEDDFVAFRHQANNGPYYYAHKIMEPGFEHWKENNLGVTNSTGFTALPGGMRDIGDKYVSNDGFYSRNEVGRWWSSTEYAEVYAIEVVLIYDAHPLLGDGLKKESGNSVRCVKDGPMVPSILTLGVTDITTNSAKVESMITDAGTSAVSEKGVVWSYEMFSTLDKNRYTPSTHSTGNFYITNLTGLEPNSLYYARGYAKNGTGINYSKIEVEVQTEQVFMPIAFNDNLNYENVSDIDGNVYKTIKIGNKTWMAENLRTTKLKNGEKIDFLATKDDWINTNKTGFGFIPVEEKMRTLYGHLYNGYAAINPNICPGGWHVPTTAEYKELMNFLGGEDEAGGKLREKGNNHWIIPSTQANNSSGFSALPAGNIYEGNYYGFGRFFRTWSRSFWGTSSSRIECLYMDYNDNKPIIFNYPMISAISIRCVKD